MSCRTLLSMEQTDFYHDKLLTSESQEEFLKEYLKYDEKCAKDLYLKILVELEKTILTGNIDNFLKLCNAILYISSAEKSATLKDYYDDVKNPMRSTNLIILTCKHNNIDILKHLFGSCSGILYNLSIVVGKTTISPTDKDESGLNAFYYAMRSGNVELLNTLMNWPGNYFSAHSQELDEVLSKTFEELKLKNVPLSDQMEICVESKLIDLRFFSNSLNQNQNIKRNHSNIKERIELVLQHFNLLKEDCADTEVIDEKFLFVAKSIAQNIHILKRKLKSTYDMLPWEEMEFCLVIFVTSHSKQQEMNLFYHVLLDKNKILNHLENFVKQLSEIKNYIDSLSIGALAKLPNSKREKVIGTITSNYPQFLELYNDYQQIRDIYSLERINTYIKLALSVSPKEREGHLIITRVLQVIGEYLKNSLESPNLSIATAELLLQSLQRNTREIIIDLRNSLSHANSLSKRTEIEENKDVKFFTGIQNDAKKVGDVISDVLYKKKNKIIKTLLNKIISSENFDEISNVIKVLENAKLEETIQVNFEMSELLKLEKLVNELSSNISKKSLYEENLINRINTVIRFAKSKSEDTRIDYIKGYAALTTLSHNISPNDHNNSKIIKLRAHVVLKNVLPEVKTFDFKEIADLSLKIFHSAKLRLKNNILDEIRRLVWEIFFIVQYETSDIKWIEELRKQLNERCDSKYQVKKINIIKEEENQLSSKLSELKSFLSTNSLSDQLTEKLSFYKKDKKLQTVVEMLVLDIMSILGCSQHYLENNVLFLDDNTPLLTGKCLRNHLAHDNVLVDAFLTDPSMSIVLNAKKLTEKNIMGKKKIGKVVIDDPFKVKEKFNQQFITIINQEKMFSALEDGNFESLKDCLNKGADINARSLNSWPALHLAAKGSSLEIIKSILDQNINTNVKNVDGQNPLHIAATYGRKSIVEYFIKDVGLCVDDTDKFGKTPLHYAAQNGHKDTVEVLLKYEAKIFDNTNLGVLPPLYYAIINNHIDVCKVFLEKKLDVDNECLGGYTLLHAAAECGHLELVIFLLENGADVNAGTERNWTPLHAAAYYGYLEVVNALISGKANVNARVINGCTPLHYAVESGHIEISNVLLMHGADINAIDKIVCNTPLHHAARDGHEEIVKILLGYEVCTNAVNGGGATPLHMAARGGHTGIVTALLDHGVDIHTKDTSNATPLYYASLDGHQKVVELLIKYGANVNIKDGNDLTPLHAAALKGHRDIVDILIQNKAKVNAQDIKGNTALHAASQNGSKDVIGLLMKNEAEVDVKNNYGFTPLQTAILCGHRNAVFLLIKNSANINSRNSDGLTPLHIAVIGGHKNIVNLLIKNKADINAKSIEGVTPLHIAVEAGFKEIAETLIANDADVNVKKNSISPLLLAVKSNNLELVEILIKHGANASDLKDALLVAVSIGSKDILEILLKNKAQVNTKYEKNCTLLHIAAEQGHKEIVNILIKRGAKIDDINIHKETPLYLAVRKGNEEIVKMFIAYGASVTVVNDEGLTPLHAAAAQGHINIVKILLDKKVRIDIKDYQNRTPFEFAVSFGHLEVVKMLLNYQNINLNAKGDRDWTVLHIAAQENNLEMVKFLVNKGSNINARNSSDSKPIHIAAREGFLEAVKFFLSVGSNINDTGTDNQTLLHYAAMKNHLEVMKYLIAQGANVNAVDLNGGSPLLIATAFGYKDIIEVLLKNGALYKKNVRCQFVEKSYGGIFETSYNKEVCNLCTSIEKLYEAVKSNNPSEVEKFIKAGALVDVRYANGLTCLHYATSKGYDRIANILLGYKANPNVVDNDGYTPLHYAAKFSYLKIAKALLYRGAIYNAVSLWGKTPSNLTTDKDITSLFKLIDKSFQNVKIGNSTIVKSLNKIKEVSKIKAIMGAHNEEHKTLIVVAMLSDFKEVESLKEVLQDNVSIDIKKAELLLEQGNVQKALFMFKTIFEKRKQLFGPDNPGTLDIQTYIAKAFFKLGDYQKALSMYEEICQKQEEILGFNYKDTLSTKSSVALVMHMLGRNDKAFNIFQDVYQRQKELLGPNHYDTLDTHFYMALVLDKLEKYEEALSINREVFKKRKEKNPNDPAILQAENNIAMVLSHQGKYEEALEIYKNVLDKKKEILGMYHSSTLKTLSNIACVLANQKKYQESVKAHLELLDIQKAALGPNHPDTLYTKYTLAGVYFSQTKWTSALQVYTEVLAESKLVLGYDHPIVLDISEKLKMIDEIFKLEDRDASEVLRHLKEDSYSNGNRNLHATMEKILNAGVDVNASTSDVLQHLKKDISAASDDDLDAALNKLLNAGADVNDITSDAFQHLAKEIYNAGDFHAVKQLLNSRADVNADTSDMLQNKKKDIYSAASSGNIKVLKELLNVGANVNDKDINGRTALHYAVSNEQMDVINILLKHGADVTQITNKGNTPLHTAASKGNKEIAEILLQHVCHEKLNGFINAKTTSTGTTSLHVAAKNGFFEIVKILLKHGAAFNIENKQCKTPLTLASNGNVSRLLTLVEDLFVDAKNGNSEIMKKLMAVERDEFFAAMNSHNKEGKTLLQVALINCHANVSRMLVDMLKQHI